MTLDQAIEVQKAEAPVVWEQDGEVIAGRIEGCFYKITEPMCRVRVVSRPRSEKKEVEINPELLFNVPEGLTFKEGWI